MLHKKTLVAISAHALAEYPRECCGLIVAVGRREVYRPCTNLETGLSQFRLAAEDWAAAEDAGRMPQPPPAMPTASPARPRACPG